MPFPMALPVLRRMQPCFVLLLFVYLCLITRAAARAADVGQLSVPEIEEKLQVSSQAPLWKFIGFAWLICGQECSLVNSLNEHKLATAPKTASLMSRVFAILFPGSPAVNAILATIYISGPPSTLYSWIMLSYTSDG